MKRTLTEENRLPTPAEQAGKNALYRFYREYHGCQAQLSRDTGLSVPMLTKMARYPEYFITMEAAMLVEVASKGALRAEVLCPSRADLIGQFLALRATEMVQV